MNCNLKYVNELFATEQTRKKKKRRSRKKKIPLKITGVVVHRIKLKGKIDQTTFDYLP